MRSSCEAEGGICAWSSWAAVDGMIVESLIAAVGGILEQFSWAVVGGVIVESSFAVVSGILARSSRVGANRLLVRFCDTVVGKMPAGSPCMSLRMVGAIRRAKRARSPIGESGGSVIMNEEAGA